MARIVKGGSRNRTFAAEVEGANRLQRTFDAMDPGKRKQIIRGALQEIGPGIQRLIRNQHLRGPYPSKLTVKTGRTLRGIVVDRAGLARGFVRVGVIEKLWWLENYELGRGRRGARPWLGPAVREYAPQVPAILTRHWSREIDRS